MKYPSLKERNVYVIPAGDYFSHDEHSCSMVYSPLANTFFLALPAQVEALETKAAAGEVDPILHKLCDYVPYSDRNSYGTGHDSSSILYVLPNEKCNFRCGYCYAAQGRSDSELSIGQIRTTFDHFLSNKRNAPRERTIVFIGGGEPTLSWDLLREATLLAEAMAAENDIVLNKQLTTNGSILTDEMVRFYKDHDFDLQFSFEVIPEIQDAQRGQFEKVSANLKRLTGEGVKCRIRSTITELSVERMPEMVELCHREYPGVRHITCEPVIDPDYFSSPALAREFHEKYFDSFHQARRLAESYSIDIFSSSQGTIRTIREQFCFNLYCLTPQGTLTICPSIRTPFGTVGNGKIELDMDSYQALTNGSNSAYPECTECWARWNCGGGCPNQRRVYRPDIFSENCTALRRMLRHNLINELAEKHTQATGKDFFEDITSILKNQSR